MSRGTTIALVRVATNEREALYALVDEYLAELATYRELPVGPTDAHGYGYLPLYWQEDGRHPFFIVAGGTRVGFALVREVAKQGVVQMSDFFVHPHARRSGVGRMAVAEVWRCFPGRWELQVHPRNRAAAAFWPTCIARHATGPVQERHVEEEDGRRVEYTFEIA